MEHKPGMIRFSVVEGMAKEQDAGIGVVEHGWPRQRRGLYVFVESTTADQEARRRGVEIITRVFSQGKLSITASLTDALKAAHQELLDENRRRSHEGKIGLGVTCAVVQGNNLFLAQVGPSLAYLHTKDGWFGMTPARGERSSEPLGLSGDLSVQVRRFDLGVDSVLLLAASSMAGLVSEEDLIALPDLEQSGRTQQLCVAAPLDMQLPALLVRLAWRASNLRELLRTFSSSPGTHWRESMKPALFRVFRPVMLLILVVLGLLAAMGSAWYIRGYVTGRSEARFADFLERAQMLRQEAFMLEDREGTRQRLAEAKGLVDRALEIKTEDPWALALAGELVSDLAEVNAVFKLSDVRLLADFSAFGDGQAQLAKIVVNDSDAYVLDEGNGRVYRVLLAETVDPDLAVPEVLALPGSSRVTGILWMPAGGLRSLGQLVIFDSERNFWGYENNGFYPLKVRGVGRWSALRTAVGWQGNLYVLDPPANQVWRYYPTENGYDSEMKGILDSCDLREAVDSAVDGSVYILLGSGAILKFTLGRLQDFTQEGIDRPLWTPNAIFCTPDSVLIYVVDVGNGRIVAYGRDGQFEHQLVSEHFKRLQNIYVDENKGRIYVLSDNRVYTASLPRLAGDNEQ